MASTLKMGCLPFRTGSPGSASKGIVLTAQAVWRLAMVLPIRADSRIAGKMAKGSLPQRMGQSIREDIRMASGMELAPISFQAG